MNITLGRAPWSSARLRRVFRETVGSPRVLTMWRCVVAGRGTRDASGSAAYAGRWHHPSESLALYTAETRALAISEALEHFLPGLGEVWVTVDALRISGRRVLDVVNVERALPWPLSHLLEDGHGYLRAILVGTEACRAGVDVLVVPSAVDSSQVCAVCYMRHAPDLDVISTEAVLVHT